MTAPRAQRPPGHDLAGPLLDLVTAALADGEAP
jgi:hypothetical protein